MPARAARRSLRTPSRVHDTESQFIIPMHLFHTFHAFELWISRSSSTCSPWSNTALLARGGSGQPVAARAQPQHPGPGNRAGPAAARPRHAPATPDRLRRLRRGARAPHAPRRDRATARTQAHARRRIRQPQHRPESHSGPLLLSPLLAHMTARHPQVRVSVELGATDALLALLRAERIDALVCDARLLHDAPDIYAQPLAPLRAGLCAGPDIPSWRIGASASRRSGNTRSRPPRSVRKSRCGWPRPWPRRRSRTNGDRALREPGSADAPGAGQRRAAARRDQRHPPRAGSRPAAGSAHRAGPRAARLLMRWRAWPAARRRRCWMRSMPTRGSAGPTSRPTRNDRVENRQGPRARLIHMCPFYRIIRSGIRPIFFIQHTTGRRKMMNPHTAIPRVSPRRS